MKRTDELLTAYADGGLSPDEVAEVEALLATSPEARAELEAIRRLLAGARRAERATEPDWDAMAREIHRACDQVPTSRFAWLWRPRHLAIGALAATAAAALLFVALRPGDGADRAPRAAVVPEAPAAAPAAPVEEEADALPALREPEVDELNADELALLEGELAWDDLGDDGFIADLLAAPGDGVGEDDDALDVFDDHPLTADELAEELPPDAIEKLDQFLAEVSAG